jgi:hypothetical protein
VKGNTATGSLGKHGLWLLAPSRKPRAKQSEHPARLTIVTPTTRIRDLRSRALCRYCTETCY